MKIDPEKDQIERNMLIKLSILLLLAMVLNIYNMYRKDTPIGIPYEQAIENSKKLSPDPGFDKL